MAKSPKASCELLLNWRDVCGHRTLGTVRDVVADSLPLLEGLEAVPTDSREVGKDLAAAAIGEDIAEALRVEPLHGAGRHVCFICAILKT